MKRFRLVSKFKITGMLLNGVQGQVQKANKHILQRRLISLITVAFN